MLKSKTRFYAIVSITVLFLYSCGGNTSSADQEGAQAATPEVKKMTPDDLGAAVSELYVSAMSELNELTMDHPPADEVEPKIEALKENYIQKMVEYGKKREALSEDERSKMDLAIRVGLNDVYDNQVYTTYSETVNDYFDQKEVRELLTSFNILTQYANFELLKQQEPEEAQRLGIE